jgi:hypothetical protein
MKPFIALLFTAVLSASAAFAQTPFAATGPLGSGTGSAISSVAIPATGYQKIRIQYLNATSDAASGALTFYQAAGSRISTVLASSASGQAVISAVPYSGAAQNDVIVLHSYATNTVARGAVATTGSNSITLQANLPFNLSPGDKIYLMLPNGTISVGAATKEVTAPTIFATSQGPALIDLSGTAACRINLVAGEYQ